MHTKSRCPTLTAALCGALLLQAAGDAKAWGATGHRAVCEIAFRELEEGPRRIVSGLIDRDRRYRRFAESCTWADGPPRQRERDHYVNLARDARAVTLNGCPLADTCLLSAIDADALVLASPDSSEKEQLVALKLLGHWVGDIHQPMHVTFADDRGANAVGAVIEEEGELVETNLHEVWDDWIIARRLGDDYMAIADRLQAAVSDAERERWRYDSPVEWANESFQIAIAPSSRYCVLRQGACWYANDNFILNAGETRRELAIDDSYLAEQQAIVEQRLTRAGVRLGALLNRLLR